MGLWAWIRFGLPAYSTVRGCGEDRWLRLLAWLWGSWGSSDQEVHLGAFLQLFTTPTPILWIALLGKPCFVAHLVSAFWTEASGARSPREALDLCCSSGR